MPAALTGLFVGNFEEAIRKFEQIAAIAQRIGDRELAAHAAFGRGKCLTTVGRTAEGFAGLDQAMAAVVRRRRVAPLDVRLLPRGPRCRA